MTTGTRTIHPLSIFAVAILLFSACASETDGEPQQDETARSEVSIPFKREGTLTFERGDQDLVTIDIEIAETDSARERGLMQRNSLPDRSGMLFIFEREEPQNFWMANTPLSLDIFFVNADSQIVNIARYTKPYSSQEVPSVAPAMYVVETEAGFADTYGITETDQIRWTRIE